MSSGTPEAPFFKTLATFCNELRLTFPELAPQIDRAATLTPQVFWRTWKTNIGILKTKDFDALMSDRRGLLIGPVAITAALWGEVSAATHSAIWRYLRTLVLESAMEVGMDGMEASTIGDLLSIFKDESMVPPSMPSVDEDDEDDEEDDEDDDDEDEGDVDPAKFMEQSAEHLLPFFKKLQEFVGSAAEDISGVPMPEIPAHLRNGHIARLAENLAKQFKPEEFGIDPAVFASGNAEEIVQRLMELHERDPTVFIGGLKRITEKIKRQIMGGSLDREQIIAEAKEYMDIFKSHPAFKSAIDKVTSMFGPGGIGELLSGMGGGGGGSGAPSERLRAVQERLRRKMAARNAGGKTSAQGK
jgi:hypothetical protein